MASYRRRGAHAAARGRVAPFVAVKRVPPPAVGRPAPLKRGTGGIRVSGIRARIPRLKQLKRLKLVAAAIVVVAATAGFVSGLSGDASAEPTVQAFLLAWGQGQYRMAAAMTDGDPATVTVALRTAYQRLGAAAFYLTMGKITQGHGRAVARFGASVDLGQDGAPWNYQGRFQLRKIGADWKVVWSPSVINPGLRPGLRLAVVSMMPARAALLDAAGKPLGVSSPAYVAEVTPDKLASPAATARAIGKVTGLDYIQVLGVILAAPQSAALKLLTLDPGSYAKVSSGLGHVPGLRVHQVSERLFDSIAPDVTGAVGTEASMALREQGVAYRPGSTVGESGLQQVYQRRLAGAPAIEVIAENKAGHQVAVLAQWHPPAGTTVRTTVDSAVQTAAVNALDGQAAAAAIVAVQSSTGHILAAGDHAATGTPRVDPLGGHYQPGQAFTIVSTEALLSGGLQVNSPIPCPSSNGVGGQTFTNVPPTTTLGTQPLFSTDFAQACGTAFTGLSRRLNPSQLAASAAAFGLGAHWMLPLGAFPGSLRVSPGGDAGLAADTIGQGGVQVSPLAMALIAAGVDSGIRRPPMLVTDPADPGLAPRAVASAQTLASLRALMRSSVSSGAAHQADLAGAPVYGQVGSAPATAGSHLWASWFVGYRGDVAFAVLELTKSPSTSAVPLGAAFLAGLPAG
jgi:cell division protein FtsI/penicillin-binding protein 2